MSKKYPVAESTKSEANLSEDVFNSLYKNSIADLVTLEISSLSKLNLDPGTHSN